MLLYKNKYKNLTILQDYVSDKRLKFKEFSCSNNLALNNIIYKI